MKPDEFYMNRCLELAKQGLGMTAPNPLVGSVIVYQNKIIGEGFHRQFGESHAEVNAIISVKDKSLLKNSTLYVNLEPCAHKGKTPPCTDLIISSGIPKVVIGAIDPNILVKGKGEKKLKGSGVIVISEVLPENCIELNKRFFTYHVKKRPYIILKWAQTKDGFIDIIRNPETPVKPNWISNEQSQLLVHKWRSEEQAILAGTNTVIYDNPRLTTREWYGKNPLRIFLDNTLRVPESMHLLDNENSTLVINDKKADSYENTEFLKLNFSKNNILEQLMIELYKREIQSIIIEGGKKLLESFIGADYWDEARVFTGNKTFNEGIESPKLDITPSEKISIGKDILHIYKNYKPSLNLL